MTGDYLRNITPDSVSGILLALEGVGGCVALLNGPSGCKFYHSSVSDNQMIRQLEFDPLNFPVKWYFGQPRVPCTYLDNGDYVYGSEEKIREAMEFFRDELPFSWLFVVNSPGAALIGDNLAGLAEQILPDRKVMVIETPGFSETVSAGYARAGLALLDAMAARGLVQPKDEFTREGRAPRVNLIGHCLFQRNLTGDVEEMERLFALMGVEVNCVFLGGSRAEACEQLGNADLNVVVWPEYGVSIAKRLQEMTGVPYYVCTPPPVGFASAEKMLKETAELLGADPGPALDESGRARARCYAMISRMNSLTGMPDGVPYAAEGRASELLAYVEFLTGYLGMVPDALSLLDPEEGPALNALRTRLAGLRREDALSRAPEDSRAQLVFASANTLARMKFLGKDFSGIETGLPTFGYYDVIPKTHLGIRGGMLLVEMVLNGLRL